MDVFIMWAGDQSHAVARALKQFLEFVVRGPKYFISDDIEGGRLWRVTLAGQLETASFGVACLTWDNLRSHWLHFEAGALSKAVGQTHVIPFLLGPSPTDVDGPLSDFQMISCDEAGIRKMASLLAAQTPHTSPDVIEKSFRYEWPAFEKTLAAIRANTSSTVAESMRSETAILQEVLDRVRRLESRPEPATPRVEPPAERSQPAVSRVESSSSQTEKSGTSSSSYINDPVRGSGGWLPH